MFNRILVKLVAIFILTTQLFNLLTYCFRQHNIQQYVQCILYILHFNYNIQYTLYNIRLTLYSVHCTLYIVHSTVYNVYIIVQFTIIMYNCACTLYMITINTIIHVHYKYNILYSVIVQCTSYNILCTVYSVHYILYSVRSTLARGVNKSQVNKSRVGIESGII